MKCKICAGETTKTFELIGNRSKQPISSFFCKACNFYCTNPPSVNYEDWNGVQYYLHAESYIRERQENLFSVIENVLKLKRRIPRYWCWDWLLGAGGGEARLGCLWH